MKAWKTKKNKKKKAFDKDDDGKLNRSDFCAAVQQLYQIGAQILEVKDAQAIPSKEELETLFDKIDASHNQQINFRGLFFC